MSTISNKQKQYAARLLREASLWDDREDALLQLTNGRTGSIRELTAAEANKLIQMLRDPQERVKDSMRKKLLSYAHQLRWWQQNKPGHVDLEKVDNWCQHYGIYKKKLNEHTMKELAALVS
jgi:acyl transferase domain-containing protein